MRVLIVENTASTDGAALTALSSPMVSFTTVEMDKATRAARDGEFDAIVLEIVPSAGSTDLVQQLRLSGLRVPVLLLAPTSCLVEVVRTLSAGADDYLTLPVDPESVLKRLIELGREHAIRVRPVLTFGGLKIDLDRRRVHANGERIHLTGKEFQILELLAVRKGMTVTKQQMLDYLYSGAYVPVNKIIDVFICKLRHKLMAATKSNYIDTDWGRGYVMRDPDPYSEEGNMRASA